VQLDNSFEEDRLGAGDILDGLTWHGVGQEADKIGAVSFRDDRPDGLETQCHFSQCSGLITTDVPRKTFDKLVPHGIGNAGENNWDSGSCALSGNRGWTGYCDQ